VPSVVKQIAAPLVASDRTTDCVEVYVPAAGLGVGVATIGRAETFTVALPEIPPMVAVTVSAPAEAPVTTPVDELIEE
jgi:hypothetical protein